jgi:hypothetical protein
VHNPIVIDATTLKLKGLGRMSFAHLPRIGEKISVKKDGKELFYEVIMVVHDSSGAGCDIYISHPTTTLEGFVGSLTR